jgi:erythromycin esterase-like protein
MNLRNPPRAALRQGLEEPRLERAIGVVYRPDTEMASHYFYGRLAQQFDEYIWFDQTSAVSPIGGDHRSSLVPTTYPFPP